MDSDDDCKNIIDRLTATLNRREETPCPSSLGGHFLDTRGLLAPYEAGEEAAHIIKSWKIVEEEAAAIKAPTSTGWRSTNKPMLGRKREERKVEEEDSDLEEQVRIGME